MRTMITPQQIVAIGLRLFAVFLGIRGLYVLYLLLVYPAEKMMFMPVVVALLCCAAAIGLWLFPMLVAQRIIPRTRHANHIGRNAHEFARVGACLIGLWYFAHAVSNLAVFVYYAAMVTGEQFFFRAMGADNTARCVLQVGELVVSILLMKGSGWFATRICGLERKADPATPLDQREM
jgi:hypothetical protein